MDAEPEEWIIRRDFSGFPPRYLTKAGGWSSSESQALIWESAEAARAYLERRGWEADHFIVRKP